MEDVVDSAVIRQLQFVGIRVDLFEDGQWTNVLGIQLLCRSFSLQVAGIQPHFVTNFVKRGWSSVRSGCFLVNCLRIS